MANDKNSLAKLSREKSTRIDRSVPPPGVYLPTEAEIQSTPLRKFDEIDPMFYAQVYRESCYPRLPYPDTKIIIEQFVQWFQEIGSLDSALEIGCGPVISHILTAVPYVSKIVMSDYLSANLDLLEEWRATDLCGGLSWNGHTEYVLAAEGHEITTKAILKRERQLKEKLSALVVGDLRSSTPLGLPQTFSVVMCCYATEQAARSLDDWYEIMGNLSSTVRPGGYLFLAMVRDSDYYVIGDGTAALTRIPIIKVTDADIIDALRSNGFIDNSIRVVSEDCSSLDSQGLGGILLAYAQKSPFSPKAKVK